MSRDVETWAEPAVPDSMPNPPQPDDDPVLQGLTEAQRSAVVCTEGPLLVLAGPGSGKTRVITRRIAYLVACGIPAWQILALTFTNKAAGEMRERVHQMLGDGPASRGLTVTTFHSLCARLLRRFAEIAALPGLKPDYAIYDAADQSALMKKVISDLGLNTANFPPRSVLARISTAKNDLLDAEAFTRTAGDFSSRSVAKIYTAYEASLRRAGAVDFDDLLLLTAQMLKTSAAVRDACRDRWRYLLIDEYQDTNRAQFVIASLLAGEVGGGGAGEAEAAATAAEPAASTRRGPNICVVGDPDQSIYGWRGADIANILQFEEQYPGAAVIALGENFRSTKSILAAADALIRHNRRRKHKDLFTARAQGDKIEVVLCRDEHHEARLVVDWLRERRADSAAAWKDCAVFYRTNALSRVLEDQMRAAGVPYVIARGTAFYQREEVKNALAYLRVVANPADGVSLGRVINTPSRGIGDATWVRVEAAATDSGSTAMRALRDVASGNAAAVGVDVGARAQNAIRKFLDMIDGWTGSGSFMGSDVASSLSDLVERVIRESGLEAMYKAGRTDTDEERLENLAELVSSAAEFEQTYDPTADPANEIAVTPASPSAADDRPSLSAPMPPLLALLRAYLEQVTLVADADAIDPAQGAVTLMTLHAAKGLEFPAVAMVGLEEGCLPHMRSNESDAELEEERRLCFVGITRAMQRLLITSARYRTVRGIGERTIPSRFLDELPREYIAVSDQADPGAWDDSADHDSFSDSPRPSRAPSSAQPTVAGLKAGAMVAHPQFGVGRVESIVPGANARATVSFRDVGRKTLVLEYARLKVIG
ncbi:MAG: UvrD-helicase domain-containing protein [Phycisphaeraceae bacterium]|nr:UvrD-helicase domain-containing protein [Phycisphaeraceae bacterium]